MVDDIHHNTQDGLYYAWSGEHHRARTVVALHRRLRALGLAK
jgi:hypothetical protein